VGQSLPGIPGGISLIPAIGNGILEHIFQDVFPKYSLNFVDGIGQVDGENLWKLLWWPIDKVAGILGL